MDQSAGSDINRKLEKVRSLKRSLEIWHVSSRRARVWVTPRKRDPYRPYHMLVISDHDQVVKAELVEDQPSPDQLWEYLLKAMARPMLGGGQARRPQEVTFDDEEIAKALTPRLDALEIHGSFQAANPLLKDMLQDLEKMMNRKFGEIQSLLSIPRATVPLLGRIFASAADLYRLEPWNKLDYHIPIAIWTSQISEPRYLVITGGKDMSQGLSIHDSFALLQKMYTRLRPARLSSNQSWLTLTYGHASGLSFDDLDAIEEYSLAVAGDHAFPLIFRVVPPAEAHPPTIHDLFWLESTLPALVRYFQHDFVEGIKVDTPVVEFTYDIKTLDGTASVKLHLPIIFEERS